LLPVTLQPPFNHPTERYVNVVPARLNSRQTFVCATLSRMPVALL
jgi:hypothetical protein